MNSIRFVIVLAGVLAGGSLAIATPHAPPKVVVVSDHKASEATVEAALFYRQLSLAMEGKSFRPLIALNPVTRAAYVMPPITTWENQITIPLYHPFNISEREAAEKKLGAIQASNSKAFNALRFMRIDLKEHVLQAFTDQALDNFFVDPDLDVLEKAYGVAVMSEPLVTQWFRDYKWQVGRQTWGLWGKQLAIGTFNRDHLVIKAKGAGPGQLLDISPLPADYRALTKMYSDNGSPVQRISYKSISPIKRLMRRYGR